MDAKLGFDDNAEFRQKEAFSWRDVSQEDADEVKAAEYVALKGKKKKAESKTKLTNLYLFLGTVSTSSSSMVTSAASVRILLTLAKFTILILAFSQRCRSRHGHHGYHQA